MDSYHVLNLVGEGSFGRVYKGRKKFTGKVVALKFMPKVGRTEKELRSLKREIEIMRDLRHPNIVQLFDSFETETEVVVVTEYAEGQLFQILEDDGHLPESQVREIACQLVSALYYLHSHRILHRDMKPQNILLGKSGVVKLCDFGFARAMSVSTLVLTSIKGTPLYMSPEIVEEKPYDHTADLWALGCILYELHTGVPPFYTNSIFHLVQLIVKDPIKWPDTMSDSCMSFLKGLLTKDPQKRLSWPDLLHHSFVADGVLVLSDTNLFSPLTVTPSPDVVARKMKQVAEKSVPTSGESILMRKAREQMELQKREKKKEGCERMNPAAVMASPKALSIEVPAASGQLASAANQSMNLKSKTRATPKQRGQISRDYEQEFPSVEVGPRLVRRGNDRPAALHRQDVATERHCENRVQETDLSRQQKKLVNYNDIICQIKSSITAFQVQLIGVGVINVQQIEQVIKVLRNLIVTPDLEKSHHISHELKLPQSFFELIRDSVSNTDFIKEQRNVLTLGEIIKFILFYWERHRGWVEDEPRLEEFTEPLKAIISQSDLTALAPLAASVLSLFTLHGVDVFVDVENLTSLLKMHPSPLVLPPPGWGLYDGLLSLLLHALSEDDHASVSSKLNPLVFLDLWKKVGSSLASPMPNLDLFSADGIYSFLSIALLIFTKDLNSCIPLFSDKKSQCVYTLCRLLSNDCPHLSAKPPCGTADTELSCDSLSTLSCHLLCFPFALDLPPHTMAAVLQVYDSCHVASSLLQVIQTFPPSQLELPLSLLSRLLLCDPERSVSHVGGGASGFFSSTQSNQLFPSKNPTAVTRTASSLLSDLLRQDELWDCAVELLNLLSQVARCSSQPASPRISVEAAALQQALTHPYDQIRVATCRFVGNLEPFRANRAHNLQADIFRQMIDALNDSCTQVRRTACRAVGNWLGYVAAKFKTGGSRSDSSGWGKESNRSKEAHSHVEAAGDAVTEQMFDADEQRRWTDEAQRSAASLTCLLSDRDAVTRRHCCAALGNLVNVDGVVSVLDEEAYSSLLRVACNDSNNGVREAAIAALKLCSQQDAVQRGS
ncbi:serine/threonine-protein kinase 36 isoform X1 [Poecilia latipinna]|uniref:non-specific serine/threonine protein kinase n=1 Tax=Poecilia latipinna TaxID=48699 RepID=A0A3B3U377_9TELE|nr:PREDICTED: serine/threonine-protein kinase 36 isoform X1 [Poecilia latipinna]XP_014873127.1 PREDICTED: serine/threonine-protein kinase 36 isoform X1 [Poecilia latipinna]XP_014873128.1 PREDICTED: serine/threonine-protein kinase 36 isoform X1 [Poecilia latipinna]XP_014873129.1 PREDICTED: serine/threonine-protein kinase 36 isoform X1 [Poecilia latipinna]